MTPTGDAGVFEQVATKYGLSGNHVEPDTAQPNKKGGGLFNPPPDC